jgi:hypothetical protein
MALCNKLAAIATATKLARLSFDAESSACTPACTDSLEIIDCDADLARIVAAWDSLPPAIRKTMLNILDLAN